MDRASAGLAETKGLSLTIAQPEDLRAANPRNGLTTLPAGLTYVRMLGSPDGRCGTNGDYSSTDHNRASSEKACAQ